MSTDESPGYIDVECCGPEYDGRILVGDSVGLVRLRDAISTALTDGECHSPELGAFSGVKCVESQDLSRRHTYGQDSDGAFWGCLGVAGLIVLIFGAGVYTVVTELWRFLAG